MRSLFFAVIGCALMGCIQGASAQLSAAKKAALDRALESTVAGDAASPALAGLAVAVAVGDELVYEGAAGCALFDGKTPQRCDRAMKPETKLRVASVSKMALSFALHDMVNDGLIDLDRDVSDYLGWALRNPDFPDRAITARQLLSHTSSIRDPEAYWVAAPGRFRMLFEEEASPFAVADNETDTGPGAFFTYANLNYGVLATVMEKAGGERFDLIMRERLFDPQKLDAGFNWSGVSRKARRRGAALYRVEEGGWAAQVDDVEMLNARDPVFLKSDGLDTDEYLERYAPGDNATLFSPQGGLRASVIDLVSLLSVLREDDAFDEAEWRYVDASPNGDTEERFFDGFGRGVQIVDGNDAFATGLTLIGHSGEAYGLHSGAWLIRADPSAGRDEDIRLAFAITGAMSEIGKGVHPTFNAVEEKLMRFALGVAGVGDKPDTHHARDLHDADEPQPFDASSNAMMDVNAALAAAAISGKRPLLVLGANWCHDSRGLAAKFLRPEMETLLSENYELVWVDVGRRDRNLDIAERFGVSKLLGTPTVLILSPSGELLNADSVHDWRRADSTPYDEVVGYFQKYAGESE
ncbi:MAG: serine hydrolase [Pseudomonadota bacterium]